MDNNTVPPDAPSEAPIPQAVLAFLSRPLRLLRYMYFVPLFGCRRSPGLNVECGGLTPPFPQDGWTPCEQGGPDSQRQGGVKPPHSM